MAIYNKSGFSVTEFIIAVAVMGILAAILIVLLKPSIRVGEGLDAQRRQDLQTIAKALEYYAADHNGNLPSFFSSSTVGVGQKSPICSTAGTKSCGDQTRACIVVNSPDFIGVYLASLPIDPDKTDATDSGYFLTRTDENTLALGVCKPYDSRGVMFNSTLALPNYISVPN